MKSGWGCHPEFLRGQVTTWVHWLFAWAQRVSHGEGEGLHRHYEALQGIMRFSQQIKRILSNNAGDVGKGTDHFPYMGVFHCHQNTGTYSQHRFWSWLIHCFTIARMWTTTGTRSSWWAPKTSRSAPWNRRTRLTSAGKGLVFHTCWDDIMVYPELSLVSLGCGWFSINKCHHSTSSTAQGGGGIGHFRRGELLWCMDGRANPLMDRTVVGVVFFGKVAMVAVANPPATSGCSVPERSCSCSRSVVEL